MRTNKTKLNCIFAKAACGSWNFQAIAEESGNTFHLLRREWWIPCRILIALLVFSSIAFAQIKSVGLSDFSEGLVAVNEPTGEPKEKEPWYKYWGKCGYRNKKGEWIIPAQFDWAGPFHEGYALVVLGARVHSEILRTKWEKLGYGKARTGGRTLLFDGGRLAVIDKTGRVLMELPKLDGKLAIKVEWIDGSMWDFSSGGRFGTNVPSYMDSKLNDTYRLDRFYFQEGRAVVQLPNGCNYLQKSGDSLAYAFSQPFNSCLPFSQGLAGVMDSSKKWGFIRMDGSWQIPAAYEEVKSFSNGVAPVKTGGRWGAIDKTGTMVIPAKYKNEFHFTEGLALINEGGKQQFIDRAGKTLFIIAGKCEDFSHGTTMCHGWDWEGTWISFDKTGRLHGKGGNSKDLEKDLETSPGAAKPDEFFTGSPMPDIQDKTEYDAYMSALKSTALEDRATALEAFAGKYPNSSVRMRALEGAMFASAQALWTTEAAKLVQSILKLDPNHVRALAVMVFVKRYDAWHNDAQAANEVGLYAERGLKSLPTWRKPDAMSDQDYKRAYDQAAAMLHGGAGYSALLRRDYRSARDHFRSALAIDANNIYDTYQLGMAELEMQPPDVNGFWHIGRAVQMARTQNDVSSEDAFSSASQAKYREYHGSDEGWDAIVTQAAQLSPPPGFTVRPGSTPNPTVNPNADKSAVASSMPGIQDKVEYNAYMSALKSADLLQRAAALETFVSNYPNSVVKFDALEGALFAYAQANSLTKAAELAGSILKLDPNHVRALAVMTFVKRYAASQNDSHAAAEIGYYAERGLKALSNWQKPNAVSDAEYAKVREQAAAMLYGGAGYDALLRKNFEAARNYFQKALAIESSNLLDTYQLSMAELEMQPIDVNGFWHIGRAIQLARVQGQPAAEQSSANYGKARYRNYHGSDEGWDALVAQAKGQAPPPGFTVQRGSASALPANQSTGINDSFWGDYLDDELDEIEDGTPQEKKNLDGKLPSNRKEAQGSAELSAALAKAFYEKGDFDAAIRESDAAIRLDPNMASAYYFRGASYQQKADYYKALVEYNRALHFDPKYTNALGGRADVYYFTRQNQLAIEDYTAFIAANPKSSVAYSRRATCHFDMKEYPQSIADYEKAIVLDPNLLEAYNALAWMLATAPVDGIRNGLKAVGYGEKALSLAGQNKKFFYMDTLATAYAEAGRFADAVAMQSKAIALIPKEYDAKEAAQFKIRLQAYIDSKPWRDQP